ncbi:MAG: hypothetical protein AAFV29_06935 [Myxococcota bacterium]
MTKHVTRLKPKGHQLGLTLIEIMVGFTIAILLTLAAVSFAAHETRLMGISRDRLDLAQASRAAIDLIAEDIKQAGAGVGYQTDGTFGGLLLGRFSVPGGAAVFNPNGGAPTPAGAGVGVGPGVTAAIPLTAVGRREAIGAPYVSVTTDIGIVTANGSYATIADFNPAGAGLFCRSPETAFRAGEDVVFRTQSGFDAFSGTINVTGNAACNTSNGHDCINGCTSFTFAPNAVFATDIGAQGRSYLGGEIAGGLKTVVWFVASNNIIGTLRRAVFDDRVAGCAGRNNACGAAVVDNVESLVVQAWTFAPALGTWARAGQVPINVNNRIRVDVEMVLRSRKSSERRTLPVNMNLLAAPNNCVPSVSGCPANPPPAGFQGDWGQRRVIRTSIEVKNSGRMAMQ